MLFLPFCACPKHLLDDQPREYGVDFVEQHHYKVQYWFVWRCAGNEGHANKDKANSLRSSFNRTDFPCTRLLVVYFVLVSLKEIAASIYNYLWRRRNMIAHETWRRWWLTLCADMKLSANLLTRALNIERRTEEILAKRWRRQNE